MITGATGYLGSELVKKLLQCPDDFQVSILYRSSSKFDRLSPVMGRIQAYDVEKIDLTNFFKLNQFHAIVHCATEYGRQNKSLPNIMESNVFFPLRLLQGAIAGQVNTFINIDTMLSDATSQYSLSKAQFRQWLLSMSKEIGVANIRMEHFYGPGDGDSKFITHIIKSLLNEAPEIPLTLGLQKRDFVYIDDAIQAIYLILNQALAVEESGYREYELGSGTNITIKEVVEKIKTLSGNQKSYLKFGAIPYREAETMEASVNLDALKKLGWSPQWGLDDGLKKSIAHQRSQ